MLVKIFNLIFVILLNTIFPGCSTTKEQPLHLEHHKVMFDLTENNNSLKVERESGLIKKKNEFVVKQQIFADTNTTTRSKPLERTITISNLGSLNKKVNILRPKSSQHTVWFEGKKYFTETRLNPDKRALEVVSSAPESSLNVNKKIPFPQGTGVFCYYSQLIECIDVTGFLKLSQEKKTGQINFHIIWEGYPYIQEQYADMPNEVFSEAQLIYEGQSEENESRYALQFAGQSITYMLDKNNKVSKMYWISQGISQIRQSSSRGQNGTASENGTDLFDSMQIK